MENASFMKKIGLMLTVALLMGSSVTSHAFPYKGATAVAVLVPLMRLASKTAPAADRLTVTSTLEQLSENASKGELTAIGKLFIKFLDDVVVGYKGSNSGLRVAGSSTIIEGDDTLTAGIQDGEAMQFYMKTGKEHYGFTATAVKTIKEFKESLEVLTNTFKLLDGRNAAAWYNA